MADQRSAPLNASSIWQGIIAVLRPDFGVYLALVAPFTLLVSMVVTQFGPPQPTSLADFTPKVAVILLLVPSIIGAIGQLALTWLIATPGGTPGRALAAAGRTLPGYLLAVLLITPATSLGLLLFVLPGLYLFARMFLVGPVMIIESLVPMAALRRSWALTGPFAWKILLFLVLALLFVFGASVLASGVGAALGLLLTALGLKLVGGFAAALVAAIVSMLFTMASAAAGVEIYRRIDGHTPG
jgi:Membrane domain of glycerophosphoryl diester phosphodiesterase